MKTILSLLIVLLPGASFGGPFVSGGMPSTLKCGDDTMSYQFEVMLIGPKPPGTLYQIVDDSHVNRWDFACNRNADDNAEAYTCPSEDGTHVVHIFRQQQPNDFYGVVTSGDKNSENLKCY